MRRFDADSLPGWDQMYLIGDTVSGWRRSRLKLIKVTQFSGQREPVLLHFEDFVCMNRADVGDDGLCFAPAVSGPAPSVASGL